MNTWMSTSKPYYISWNAANLADNRNKGTTMYILFIISIIISVKYVKGNMHIFRALVCFIKVSYQTVTYIL